MRGHILWSGYWWDLRPGHPRANKRGYVMSAVLAWETSHGKPFPEDKMPHYHNDVKTDDRPENIMAVTRSEHSQIHGLGKPDLWKLAPLAGSRSRDALGRFAREAL